MWSCKGDQSNVPGRHDLVTSADQPKSLENDEGRVIHREGGITENSGHVLAAPQGLVSPSPRVHRLVPLSFISDVREVDVAERHDANARDLDGGHGFVARVDDQEPLSGLGQRLVLNLIRHGQARRCGLASTHYGLDQPISQRTREGELRDRQLREIVRLARSVHATKRSHPVTPRRSRDDRRVSPPDRGRGPTERPSPSKRSRRRFSSSGPRTSLTDAPVAARTVISASITGWVERGRRR